MSSVTGLIACLLAFASPSSSCAGERCLAIDGDTLVCNRKKVRIINLFAAELDQPGGHAAKQRLRVLLSSGDVTLKALGADRYGRVLAEVYVNGRRIEQSDVGPLAGRGAHASAARHTVIPSQRPPQLGQ